MKAEELAKLVTYIEENLRASPAAGFPFVDSRHFKTRLASKQNHVVFGRRGAGKTSLVKSTADDKHHLDVYLNLEDYKDITFPNVLIHILFQLFTRLRDRIKNEHKLWWIRPRYRATLRNLRQNEMILQGYLHQPDSETQSVESTEASTKQAGVSGKTHGLGAGWLAGWIRSIKVIRSLPKDKLTYLRLELPAYKELLVAVAKVFRDEPIFLIMDDFYFIHKKIQPELIDYIHRLTKGTSLFIKVATITHRSKLYRRDGSQYMGVELKHDIFEVDIDYTLDNFEELQGFMQNLLRNAIKEVNAQLDLDDMFAGDGFSQLCLASGGVPRDFLSLFVTLANKAVASDSPIGKMQVNEVAIGNYRSKIESMRRDSGDEDAILEGCLKRIKRYVYEEKRTNAFLISKDDLDSDPQGRQAIRELIDLRLIHLVDHNTSKAPSDGRRYEAYILDVSLYDNPRPRSFTQIEPGQRDEKARKDALRASPVFTFSKLREQIPEIGGQMPLTLSEE